jgi:peptidoglycan hydrolase-like protein with peptidoglycan-binding domain
VLAAALLAGGGLWGWTAHTAADAGNGPSRVFQGATEQVVRGDLAGATSATGTLRFASPRTLQTARAGTVTALPAPGTVVGRGGRLYSIDDTPVFLLRGGLPAWRHLERGVDGDDVRQLQENLNALGHAADVDGRFRWNTERAVKGWQRANGLDRTGVVPLGSVVFADSDLRVGAVSAALGDIVGTGSPLFEATGTAQIVEVDLELDDQRLAVLDAPVTVRLPGGVETAGTITSVGTPTEVDRTGGQAQTVIPVVVALDDPAAAATFQQASVIVNIPSERRADVLSVPVGALLAITPQQFGVEVVDPDGRTRQVPVTTGLFAGGRVEIGGDGIEAGQHVVVPQR